MNQKIVTILFGILAVVYFAILPYQWPLVETVAKALPVLLLALATGTDGSYNRLLSLGLLLSVLGDVLLAPYFDVFIAGLIAFLLAHVAYIFAFVQRDKRWHVLPGLYTLPVGAVLLYVLWENLGQMVLPVIIYMLVILTMLWRAVVQRNHSRYAIWAALGALSFVFSDSVLSYNKFVEPVAASRWLIMVSYWAAQYMLYYSRQRTETAH